MEVVGGVEVDEDEEGATTALEGTGALTWRAFGFFLMRMVDVMDLTIGFRAGCVASAATGWAPGQPDRVAGDRGQQGADQTSRNHQC